MRYKNHKLNVADPSNNPVLQLVYFIIGLSCIFFFCIAIDISPLLRGPGSWPPEWRWGYLYINTFTRLIIPVTVALGILYVFWKVEHSSKDTLNTKMKYIILALVCLDFIFQLSVLFYSRSGINVLIHRIIDPELNGYFSAGIAIQDPLKLLSIYHTQVLNLPMHAQGHPPAGIFFFWFINLIFTKVTIFNGLVSRLHPTHDDVAAIWNTLKNSEKVTAVVTAFLIPLLSSVTIIPLYYAARKLYGFKTAIRSVFIFCFIPSVVLFTPINDVFLPIITAVSLFLFSYKNDFHSHNPIRLFIYIFCSGLVLSAGIMFSLTFVPIIVSYFIWLILDLVGKKLAPKMVFKIGILLLIGVITIPLLSYILWHFNWYLTVQMNVHGLPPRSYWSWLFYNPYDFFVFLGIPLLIGYIYYAFKQDKKDNFYFSFLATFILLILSGSVRGEVGRIWIPFIPLVLIPVVYFFSKGLHFSSKLFLVILGLQAVQVLVLQTFWVTLW